MLGFGSYGLVLGAALWVFGRGKHNREPMHVPQVLNTLCVLYVSSVISLRSVGGTEPGPGRMCYPRKGSASCSHTRAGKCRSASAGPWKSVQTAQLNPNVCLNTNQCVSEWKDIINTDRTQSFAKITYCLYFF